MRRSFFEPNTLVAILETLERIASRAIDRGAEKSGFFTRKTILVGRCGGVENLLVPCLKLRTELTLFGFPIGRKKHRVLLLADSNTLDVDSSRIWDGGEDPKRRLRIAIFDEGISDIALDEFERLAKRLQATLECKKGF